MSDWDTIVRVHGPMVFSTVLRILGHAADTEDVVQEVFLEAHQLKLAEGVRNWGGLLRRLATYRGLDRLRQRKAVVTVAHLRLVDHDGDPEAAAVEHELADRLRQAVVQLPEREAAVFCLRYFDDLSNQQISENLNITTGAVAAALHKARAKLESMLVSAVHGD